MSSTNLTTVAVLKNLQVIPRSKTLVFNAQIFLPSSEPALVGSLHYFNADNVGFDNIGCYAVSVQVARTLPTVEVYSQTLTLVDYHVMGDIIWLISLGSPGNFDVRHCGLLNVCGVLSNINRDDLTFTINAQQYVTATKNYKPIPAKGESVLVPGFLMGVECNDNKTVKYFLIDVETVTFLGQASGATVPRAEESPTEITDGTPAKLKFTGFFSGDRSPAKGGEPPSKKHKTVADEKVPVDDKGEGSSSG
ncbi:hypothetical protein DFH08DRAFT_802557 [Mycena albidolilacea]|uniref:Uncharacterized protein n=1 Tax=Mycena albidolilacea TaxID=1033008 RepID=A0AAD7EWT2_9AGAR|nr:hypothetical protein DFH08DRAFT_802557 [Mycena albidolilacea]